MYSNQELVSKGDQKRTIKKKTAASGHNKLTIFLMVLSTILTVWMLFDKPVFAAPILEDTAITDAVEKELIADPAVPFDPIDVTTTEGIVTLTGRVDNILAQMKAFVSCAKTLGKGGP